MMSIVLPLSRPMRFLICLPLLLAGCHSDRDIYPPVARKENQLHHGTHDLYISFTPYTAHLSAETLADINRFCQVPPRSKQSVTFTLPIMGCSSAKQKSIETACRQAGTAQIKVVKKRQSVATINVYRITAPACPDWHHPSGKGDGSIAYSNFGCATALNFFGMIKDPERLFHGQLVEKRDAARDSMAVADYKAGKEIKLKVDKLDRQGS